MAACHGDDADLSISCNSIEISVVGIQIISKSSEKNLAANYGDNTDLSIS